MSKAATISCWSFFTRAAWDARLGTRFRPTKTLTVVPEPPVVDYRCRAFRSVFNLFTGTVWAGTHYSCAKIVLILRGFGQGTPTRQLADELECDYGTDYRHEMQAAALHRQDASPLPDGVTEAD